MCSSDLRQCGLACTGIPRTSLVGCGLTDHVQRTLTGIKENLTIFMRSVQKCILRYMDGNGTTCHAQVHACTFVRPEVCLSAPV